MNIERDRGERTNVYNIWCMEQEVSEEYVIEWEYVQRVVLDMYIHNLEN